MRRPMAIAFGAVALMLCTANVAAAATLTSDGTTATYTGAGSGASDLELSDNGALIRFERQSPGDTDPISAAAPCVEIDPQTFDCPGSAVVARLGDGEDRFAADEVARPVTITVDGGTDDDFVTGGPVNDRLDGGSGNDLIYGFDNTGAPTLRAGDDRIDGGPGDDNVVIPAGADEVIGGPGIDRTTFLALDFGPVPAPAAVSYSLDDQANDGPAGDGANVRSDVEDLISFVTDLQENGPGISSAGGGESAGFYGPGLLSGSEGSATLRGDGDNNSLTGGTSGDDLDGAAGNDVLSGGDGDDTLRSVDGFADRLACGPGNDTAIADTLDTVSDSCEAVQRSDVGNANDVPEIPNAPATPEDAPPAIEFVSPARGTDLGTGVTTVVAGARDDRGVSSVLFVDDDRIVCTDTTVPYTCDYQPRGEDVGRNTLIAVAVDTAQQTASTFRAFTVPRFGAPVSLTVRPTTDTSLPLRFVASGRVTPPVSVTPASACTGAFVAVQVKAGTRTISNRRVALRPDCTYRSAVTFRDRKRFGRRGTLKAVAVFAGNEVLSSARSTTRTLRVRG